MIGEVVKFLRDRLNKALPRDSDGAAEDLFAYVRSEKDDAVAFKAGAVSILLVRIEEDSTLRPPGNTDGEPWSPSRCAASGFVRRAG